MSERNAGLTADELFVGATRPPMRWGVTYSALLFNLVFTMEVFLLTKNLLTLALAAPIHGVGALLCARDARFFDLILLWGRTRIPALLANSRLWKASSYSPLLLDPPDFRGQRRTLLRGEIAILVSPRTTGASTVSGGRP
jgi:type IV secretion system protein VirB3